MTTQHARRTMTIDSLEQLDERLVLSAVSPHPIAAPAAPALVTHGTTPTYHVTGTAMDKAGQALNILYQEFASYQQNGSHGAFVSSQSRRLMISNGNVGVNIRVSGDVNTAAGQLKQLGLVVTGVDAATGTIAGSLPIGQIPATANYASVIGMSPIYRPTFK